MNLLEYNILDCSFLVVVVRAEITSQ